MQTFHIHINGVVQGVGFRPMVYQLAKEMKLNGYVTNAGDGVHIFFNAAHDIAGLFFEKIIQRAPKQSKIISSQLGEATEMIFHGFSIIVTDDDTCEKLVLMSPDTAICAACKSELHDKDNRRFRYPFITCTQCGPRYSIVNTLPYERHGTSMQRFSMCKSCNEEYNNITDRRFYSQTNSCAECGMELCIRENASSVISKDRETVLFNITIFLQQGKIVAVKGIGGYLFLCDANNAEAVQILRTRKHRPSKPFALLYPDIEMIRGYFELNKQEKAFLEGREAPIVLLYPKREAFNNLDVRNIAPGLRRLGVMLPYTPLLELIVKNYGKPLVATSANISGSPIIYKDGDALTYLFEIADSIVSYNRDIAIPQDDSVLQVSKYSKLPIILRRSRGYAPSFLQYTLQKKSSILSTGALLKSSFTLSARGNVFVSQFLGSGETFESQQMYKDTVEHWFRLYDIEPDVVIADLHPNYFSHQYAIGLAEKYKAHLEFIQHHEAHFAAVLAENNLLHSAEPVLGVIWDGTGLGTDGNIWGGEFFKYENNEMLRCCHFGYFPAIAVDKMAAEPRIAALCATGDARYESNKLKEKFTKAEWDNYRSLINTTRLFSSSVGRIFDAVASLLDICDKQSYEGEAAMYLQVLAEKHIVENGFSIDDSYCKNDSGYSCLATDSLLQGIIMDIKIGKSKSYIAAKFHYSLVCLIGMVAKDINVEKICCSGGVFQNALLADWIQKEYGNKYQLHFHRNVSPNDENISFGQFVYYDNSIRSRSTTALDKQAAAEKFEDSSIN